MRFGFNATELQEKTRPDPSNIWKEPNEKQISDMKQEKYGDVVFCCCITTLWRRALRVCVCSCECVYVCVLLVAEKC